MSTSRIRSKYRLFELDSPYHTGAEVNTGVEITRGRFKGMKYHYKKVSFSVDEQGQNHVKFGYHLIKDPKGRHNHQNQRLINLMGRILMDIMNRYGVEPDPVNDPVEEKDEDGARDTNT